MVRRFLCRQRYWSYFSDGRSHPCDRSAKTARDLGLLVLFGDKTLNRRNSPMKSVVFLFLAGILMLSTVACSQRANDVSYKDSVKKGA